VGSNDFDHAFQANITDNTGTNLGTSGTPLAVHYESCMAAPAAAAGDFTCKVLQAFDATGAKSISSGVTCSVVAGDLVP
jgi:hypothetical protein